jgi:response regulator RpfG family c-di-GMP phosphodiesterase
MIDQAASLADWLELGDEDARTLQYAVKLCEIGRLTFPGDGGSDIEPHASKAEFWIGHLDAIPEMADVAQALRLRDEDYNASQISGEEIPLHCRILTVVSAFDSALPPTDCDTSGHETAALETLEIGSETKFDPKVVKALRVIRSMDTTLANATVTLHNQISPEAHS